MFLSALATLNFSLAFLVGLFAAPLSFARPLRDSSASPAIARAVRAAHVLLLQACSPTAALWLLGAQAGTAAVGPDADVSAGITHVLREASFGWAVWRLYTPLVVWCVWWPAWLVGTTVVLGRVEDSTAAKTKKS
jgi:GPI-anchor transamidase subunit GAA1